MGKKGVGMSGQVIRRRLAQAGGGGRLQMFENRHLLIVQDITHGLMMFLAQGLEGIALGVSAIEGLVSQRLGLAHELLAGVVQFGALFVVQAPARI